MVFSICGPSGASKSTAVRILATDYPAYVEDVLLNSNMGEIRGGSDHFNAFLSQKWFLEQMQAFVNKANSRQHVVLDQDPTAIVEVYARRFLVENKLSLEEYQVLSDLLERIENRLRAWNSNRAVLFLDASEEVLQQRVKMRDGPQRTPPLAWFRDLRKGFHALRKNFPESEYLDTSKLDEPSLKRAIREFATRRSTTFKSSVKGK